MGTGAGAGRVRCRGRALVGSVLTLATLGLAGCGSGSGTPADGLVAPAGATSAGVPGAIGTAPPGETTSGGAGGGEAGPADRLTGSPDGTGISGFVQRNPCPTGQAKTCDAPRSPLPAAVTVTGADGATHQVSTDALGRFLVDVPAGQYRITATTEEPGHTCGEVDVTVSAGEYLPADVDCS